MYDMAEGVERDLTENAMQLSSGYLQKKVPKQNILSHLQIEKHP